MSQISNVANIDLSFLFYIEFIRMLNQLTVKKKRLKYRLKGTNLDKILNFTPKCQNQNVKKLFKSLVKQNLKNVDKNILKIICNKDVYNSIVELAKKTYKKIVNNK